MSKNKYQFWVNLSENAEKGWSKVQVLGQRGVCNSGPNGPNELKFCMQGDFVGYFWVLVTSRSYRGQTCSGLLMWMAFIEVTWPWLDQNSILTHKRPLHAKFQVIWSIGAWVTDTTLSENLDFALPLFSKMLQKHVNVIGHFCCDSL